MLLSTLLPIVYSALFLSHSLFLQKFQAEVYSYVVLLYMTRSRCLITSTGYDKPFVFGACDKRVCVNLTITNDELLEETEIFMVTLERKPDLDRRIILEPVTAEINIIDDDGIYLLVHRDHKYLICFPLSSQSQMLYWG